VKPRAPQHVIDQLAEVVDVLRMRPERCGLPDEVRNAIRPWIESWSLSPLEDLLAWAKGEDGAVRRELSSPRLKFYPYPKVDEEA